MLAPLRMEVVHEEHPDLSRRELHNVMRFSTRAIGVKYATDLLPEHFGPGASAKFGYATRDGRWLARKSRLKSMGAVIYGRRVIGGAEDDLVFTGRLREALLSSARNLISAYPSRVTIRLVGTEYFTLRPRGKRTSRLAQEVLSDNPRQLRILGETGDRAFEARLGELRRNRRLRKSFTTKG